MVAQLSAASPGELLALIRGEGGLTRAQLLGRTGMARSTLYGRLDQLQNAGLIHEAHRRSTTVGRPAAVLTFDARGRVVVTIDIGHHRATVSLRDLEGHALDEFVHRRADAESLPELVARLCAVGQRQLRSADGVRLMGVGIALPVPVDTHTGVRQASIGLPDARYPITERVSELFGVRVSVENDARALTMGAATEVPPMDEDAVLLGIKFSTGLGLGLLTGGRVLRGSTGEAGDVGHLQITPGVGAVCTCGRRGCLAAEVSGRAVVRDLSRSGVRDVGGLVALYDAGDAEVVERVQSAARTLGTHLAGFVQATNPRYVAFGGFLGGRASVAGQVISSIRERVSARISEVVEYRVVGSDRVTAAGLVALVVDDVLAPSVVDDCLSGAQ
ncbi:MAG: ROK family protein [Actinomycetes bacterium]